MEPEQTQIEREQKGDQTPTLEYKTSQGAIRKNPVILFVLAITIIAIMGLLTWQLANVHYSASPEPQPVACTTEAKLCPDGSSVSRIGTNCEFAECPGVAQLRPTTSEQVAKEYSGVLQDSYDTSTLIEYRDPRTGISFKYPKGVNVKIDHSLNGSFGGLTLRVLDGLSRQVATKLTLRATEPEVFEAAFTTGDYKSAISKLQRLPSEGDEAENISPTEIAGLRSIEYRIKGKSWEDYTGYHKRVLVETSSSTFLIMDHYLEPQCADCESNVLLEVQKIIGDTLGRIYKVEVVPDSVMKRIKEDAHKKGVQVADEIQPTYVYTRLSAGPEVYAYVSPVTENYLLTVRGYRDGLVQPVSEGLSPGLNVVEIMYVLKPDGELIAAHEIDGNVERCSPWDPPHDCVTDYECGCQRYFDIRYHGLNFSPDGEYMVYAVSERSGFVGETSLYLYDIMNSNFFPIPYATESGTETRFNIGGLYWVPNKGSSDLVIMGSYVSSGYHVGAGGYSGVFTIPKDNLGELELVHTYKNGQKDAFDPLVTKIENGSLWFEQDDQGYRIDIEKGLVEETGGQQ